MRRDNLGRFGSTNNKKWLFRSLNPKDAKQKKVHKHLFLPILILKFFIFFNAASRVASAVIHGTSFKRSSNAARTLSTIAKALFLQSSSKYFLQYIFPNASPNAVSVMAMARFQRGFNSLVPDNTVW